jgi:hypothetical protein
MATRMQQRRGTAAQWTGANPILAAGEIGFESDTSKFKIGDGVNHWDDLIYYSSAQELSSIIDSAPETLNTLNELAAALGDDPAFFTTVATNLTNHSDNSLNVHGITDTSELETQTGAQDKADAAQSAAEGYADGAITTALDNAITALNKSSVGLENVDNTSDADKPVSTATQTALDAKLSLSGGTLTGSLTLPADPSSSLHAATKQYVDNTASGIVAKPSVLGATSANIDSTYDNGTAGVGATLTHNTNGVFPAEAGGVTGWAVGKGILVKNQTNKEENGRYFISDMGSESTPYVLTRCSYCDEASEIPGAYIFVQGGTFSGSGWIQIVSDPTTFVVGTDDIDVFQFSGEGSYTAGPGVLLVGAAFGADFSVVASKSDPTFIGTVTLSESGVAFTDGTQTKEGVPSRTPIIQSGSSYTLSSLSERDSLIELSSASALTLTIPTNSTLAFPIGGSLDILQTGAGQITIAGAAGVTVNATPGLKLRTQWSSATLMKRAENSWVVVGDLTA